MNLTLHSEWPANWRTYFLQLCFDSSTRIRQFLSWVKKQRFRIFFLSSIIFPLFCLPFFYLTLLRSDNIRRQPPRPPMRLISQEVLQMDTLCPTVYISQPRSVADVWEVRAYCSSIKGKGKVMPLHGRCDPEGGYRYSSTLTWPRYYKGWVVSSTPRPHFTPEKNTVPILQEAGWAPGAGLDGRKISSPPGFDPGPYSP